VPGVIPEVFLRGLDAGVLRWRICSTCRHLPPFRRLINSGLCFVVFVPAFTKYRPSLSGPWFRGARTQMGFSGRVRPILLLRDA